MRGSRYALNNELVDQPQTISLIRDLEAAELPNRRQANVRLVGVGVSTLSEESGLVYPRLHFCPVAEVRVDYTTIRRTGFFGWSLYRGEPSTLLSEQAAEAIMRDLMGAYGFAEIDVLCARDGPKLKFDDLHVTDLVPASYEEIWVHQPDSYECFMASR